MKSLALPQSTHMEMLDCSSPAPKREPTYPSFWVSDDQMAEITSWPPGEEYVITMKVRVRKMHQTIDLKGSSAEADVEVLAYEVPKA